MSRSRFKMVAGTLLYSRVYFKYILPVCVNVKIITKIGQRNLTFI